VTIRGARKVAGAVALGCLGLILLAGAALAGPPPGPPYPDPVNNQAVYDYAGIFSARAIADAEATIDAIENRTGAEVAVYTQVKPESDTLDEANADALALMNQWGVGRRGFDDGLVILFDMEDNRIHGQVSLYAGGGFKAAYLSNSDRQAIFDEDMLPLLRIQDFDGALAAALAGVDTAATPEHANELNTARFINAAVGIGLLALSIWLIAFVLAYWYAHGRDPIYTDDPSVLMPAPPPGLTPAMATLLMDSWTSSRTASAGFVDLAAHGLIRFYKEDSGKHSFGLGVVKASAPLAYPEQQLWEGLQGRFSMWGATRGPFGFLGLMRRQPRLTAAGYVSPDGIPADPTLSSYIDAASMSTLASSVSTFKKSLEKSSVEHRWLTGEPSNVRARWFIFAFVLLLPIIPLLIWTLDLNASGGVLGAIGLGAAGLVTGTLAFFMPSRTMTGSMLRAQLLAYKRTMKATLAMSGTMDEVVARRPLPWVETPDAAMAWGVALGLNDEIDAVMRRTMVASASTGTAAGWYPTWWVGSHSSGGLSFAAGGAGGAAGLYSSSMVPDIGGMMATLGSIGSSTSSSGGSGGGFGGGGGGGGGGAGGGF
jgi:uncharacterized membrane protein YgcG